MESKNAPSVENDVWCSDTCPFITHYGSEADLRARCSKTGKEQLDYNSGFVAECVNKKIEEGK